jgi:PAS domain S-box-containing protein
MEEKTSLIKLIQVWGIVFLIGLGASFIAIDAINSYRDFKFRADQIRTDFIDRQKQMVKEEVNRVVDVIHYEKTQTETSTRNKIKSRVYEAYSIAQHIYQQNKDKESEAKIQQMILDALRPLRFEKGSGYYFITRMDGVELLFADKPQMEGLNLLNMQDTRGQYVIKDMVEIMEQSGEGFYEYYWTKPGATGNDFKKISFVTRFEPYHWLIGTGLYVDDVESQKKSDLLSAISRMRFGKEGYIFVNRFNGDALVSNGEVFSGTKKLWEIFNRDPEKTKNVFEKEYDAALNPEGDYIYYSWVKLTVSDKESPKVSFIYGIPDLQWIVGTGMYLDDVETNIASMQDQLNNQIKKKIFYFILISTVIVWLFSLFFGWLSNGLKSDINLFILFFDRAAHSDQEIDRESIKFLELDQMAECANKMLTDRKQAEAALRESEQKYRQLAEGTEAALWEFDLQSDRWLYMAPQGERILGYPSHEWTDMAFWADRIHEDDREWAVNYCAERTRCGEEHVFEYRFLKRDGSIAWIRDTVSVETSGGCPVKLRGFMIDITERKLAEEALRRSEEQYRILIENSPIGIYRTTAGADGSYLAANPALLRMLGIDSFEELRQLTPAQRYVNPSERNVFSDKLLAHGSISAEHQLKKKDGAPIWGSIVARVVRGEDGKARYFDCSMVDTTERKQAEEALRESEEQFKAIFEIASIGMAQADPRTGQFLRVNQKMSEITGYSSDEMLAMAFPEITHPEDREKDWEFFENVISGKWKSYRLEKRYVRKDGAILWVNVNMTVIRDLRGKPLRTMATIEDITERKLGEEALRESEGQLRQIIDLVPHMIFVKDWNGRYILVNQAVADGYRTTVSALTGKSHSEFHPDEDELRRMLQDDREVMEKGDTKFIKEEAYTDVQGQVRYLQTTKVPFHASVSKIRTVLGVAVDITESKRATEEREKLHSQLLQAQRLESVGRLAGGVAHDFNNMLSVILGHTEMAMEHLDSTQPLFADLMEIEKAARRSTDLIRQLLAFARRQTVAPKVLDLNQTVEGMLKMMQRLIGEDIDLAWMPGKNLWPVKVDPSQIDQILANLCVNARDAIAGMGKITIETENTAFDAAYCAVHPGFVLGEFVLLAVSDNGCGMDVETLGKVFEPFFTTKDQGEGTGLGLAMVYGIVKQNNGFINVYSEPGQGTTFKIYLPRNQGKAEQMQKEALAEPAACGHETILLAEDEPAILAMTTTMLERMGYTVLSASRPGEAIRLAEAHSSEIHLLMTDVVMPEMNGRDLAKNLLSLYPNLKRLFMSGYTANVIAHHGVLDPGVNFIQKPFSMQDLAAKLRDIFGAEDE